MKGDPFTRLMGWRRGSDRAEPSPVWWRWSPHNYPRLAEWLDHVACGGYVELIVISRSSPSTFELRAYRPDRTTGHATLPIDAGEELWLEDHWPSELIEERADDRVRGRLLP